jgi:hypothetical protein
MRGELNLICAKMQLLEKFAGVAMAEDGVGGEIVGGVHEVRVCRGGFAGSTDSGLCVADDAMGHVHQACLKQGREREDDGGGVAAGVGDEACAGNLVAVELGRSIDCLGLQRGGEIWICVVQLINGAVGALLEAPSSAEVDDFDSVLDGLRHPLPGLFVRGREEQDFDACVDDALPGEGDDLVLLAWGCELGFATSASPARPRNVGVTPANLGWRRSSRASSAPA